MLIRQADREISVTNVDNCQFSVLLSLSVSAVIVAETQLFVNSRASFFGLVLFRPNILNVDDDDDGGFS